MSKISIAVDSPVLGNDEAIKLVSKVTGCATSTAKSCLARGRDGFFYTTELFMNDYLDRVEEIQELLVEFEKLGIKLFIVEISYDQTWEEVMGSDLVSYQISEEQLSNIIEESKGGYT